MTRPSDRARTRPAIILVAILVGMLVLLYIPYPFHPTSPIARSLLNVLHLPFFIAVTLCLLGLLRWILRIPFPAALWWAGGASVLVAGGSELLQPSFGRDVSWIDFINNLSGTAIAIAGVALIRRKTMPRAICVVAATGIGLVVAAAEPARIAEALRFQHERLPVLGDFEHDWERQLWRAQGMPKGKASIVGEHATSGSAALRIDSRSEWGGVNLVSDGLDWSGFEKLRFDLFNDGDPFELGVRIDHSDGLQFSGAIPLKKGGNDCRVPFSAFGETVEFDSVVRLVLHTGKSATRRTFFLDNVRVE